MSPCPNSTLCRLLGWHVHGRNYEIWTGRFTARPLDQAICQAHRVKWCRESSVALRAGYAAEPWSHELPCQEDRDALREALERATPRVIVQSNLTANERYPCTYRGAELRKEPCKPCSGSVYVPVYECAAGYVECVELREVYHETDIGVEPIQRCVDCDARTSTRVEEEGMRVDTTATLFDHAGRAVRLSNAHRNGYLFVLGGGPSLSTAPLDALQQRGVMTLALNNAPAIVRPSMWIAMDPASNFIEHVWRDTTIAKFFPYHRRYEHTRKRQSDETLVKDLRVHQHPNVLYYKRSQGDFDPKTFFSSDTFHWGCSDKHRDPHGVAGVRSVMFPAIKLAYYLGFSTVFFVGCDFKMSVDKPYAFEQVKTRAQVNSNNRLYSVVADRLRLLRPHAERAGLRLINVTPGSRLGAVLESWSIERALDMATRSTRGPINASGMY